MGMQSTMATEVRRIVEESPRPLTIEEIAERAGATKSLKGTYKAAADRVYIEIRKGRMRRNPDGTVETVARLVPPRPSEEKVRELRRYLLSHGPSTTREMAEAFGVSPTTVRVYARRAGADERAVRCEPRGSHSVWSAPPWGWDDPCLWSSDEAAEMENDRRNEP